MHGQQQGQGGMMGMGMGEYHEHEWGVPKKHMKEFRLAMLEKKEKMLQVKMDFVKKMKEMVKMSSDEDDM